LRPGILDLGIGAAIDWQVREFQTRSDIACTVEVPEDEDPLDPDCTTEMYRIFQEALVNIARHSGAARVNVALKREGNALVLEVRDNGRGITREELSSSGALGLLDMRERAVSIGGTVSFEGAPTSGTTVRITVPLSAAP
jgi:two-component system, NarL family, sensor histidine kinase UhpB